ncbi:hypothetical protein UT300012_22100 [Paraclostridium bifermentans]
MTGVVALYVDKLYAGLFANEDKAKDFLNSNWIENGYDIKELDTRQLIVMLSEEVELGDEEDQERAFYAVLENLPVESTEVLDLLRTLGDYLDFSEDRIESMIEEKLNK